MKYRYIQNPLIRFQNGYDLFNIVYLTETFNQYKLFNFSFSNDPLNLNVFYFYNTTFPRLINIIIKINFMNYFNKFLRNNKPPSGVLPMQANHVPVIRLRITKYIYKNT